MVEVVRSGRFRAHITRVGKRFVYEVDLWATVPVLNVTMPDPWFIREYPRGVAALTRWGAFRKARYLLEHRLLDEVPESDEVAAKRVERGGR